MSRPALHLVFGMARSGTSFLARALETAPGVAVFGESDFFGRSYRPPGRGGVYRRDDLAAIARAQSVKEWTATTGDRAHPLARLPPGVYPRLVARALGELEVATPAEAFEAIAAAVGAHTGCGAVIEKTPGHLLFVDRIAEALPGVRCVASWREPAGFVRSFLALDQRDPRAPSRWLGRASRHTAVGVLMWRSYMRALQRARACLGSRLLVLSHEELRADPHGAAARAARHLGVGPLATDLGHLPRNASNDPAVGPPDDLPLWLGLLAPKLEAGVAARRELGRTSVVGALRSLATVVPASALLAARVLPTAHDPWSYVRGYLGRGEAR